MLTRILTWVLGGRPMVYEAYAFHDSVSGKPVCYFLDRYGRRWLAFNEWSRCRVLYEREPYLP